MYATSKEAQLWMPKARIFPKYNNLREQAKLWGEVLATSYTQICCKCILTSISTLLIGGWDMQGVMTE